MSDLEGRRLQDGSTPRRPNFGHGVIRMSSVVPFEIVSVDEGAEALTKGALRPGVSLLGRIPSSEVRETSVRLARALVEEAPVRMGHSLMLDDGASMSASGWVYAMAHDATPQELCYILVPQEADEERLRSIVRAAYLQAYALTYDSVCEVSDGQRLVRGFKTSPQTSLLAAEGVRVSLPDAIDQWLANQVLADDRNEVRSFLISSLSYLRGDHHSEALRKEFRTVTDEGEVLWCEGALVPTQEDEFLFCCRDITARVGYAALSGERDTLKSANRSLRAALVEGASAFMAFDAKTGTRIPTADDVDLSQADPIGDLASLVDLLRSRTRDGQLPQQIDGALLLSGRGDADVAADHPLRLSWRMWDHDGTYRLFEVTFLTVEATGAGANRLYVIIKRLGDAEAPDVWMPGLEGNGRVAGLLTRAGFEQHVARHRSGDPTDLARLFAIEADDFWNYTLDEQDELLRTLSETLASLDQEMGVRAACVKGPLYAVFLPSVPDTPAAEAYAGALKHLLDSALRQMGGVVVSIGYASCVQEQDPDGHAAFERANRALRTAQRSGGNRVLAFRPEMADREWLRSLVSGHRSERHHSVTLRTFGFFDVFVDGHPVLFSREKAKELLALLTDRRGGFVSSRDAVSCLWEDEPVNKVTLARYRKVAMHLKDTLEAYGIQDILINENGRRRLDASKVNCDLFEYLSDNPRYEHLFQGVYMLNYSWAEVTIGQLMFERTARTQKGIA